MWPSDVKNNNQKKKKTYLPNTHAHSHAYTRTHKKMLK